MSNLSDDQIKDAVVWFQEQMGLTEWSFIVETQNDPPEWAKNVHDDEVGFSYASLRFKSCYIWYSPKRCIDKDITELSVLFHEMMHAVAKDVGIKNDGDDRKEYLWDKIAEILNILHSLKSA